MWSWMWALVRAARHPGGTGARVALPRHSYARLCLPPGPWRAGAAVAITSNNWSDVVVWSPWTSMPNCYKEFVCVENAQYEMVKLGPGEFWRSQAEWTVKDL